MIIQSTNPISMPASRRAASATALGGVPMGVAMPPMFAPNGTARMTPRWNASPARTSRSSGAMIASIMAVVAVLLIHIEKNAVMPSTP